MLLVSLDVEDEPVLPVDEPAADGSVLVEEPVPEAPMLPEELELGDVLDELVLGVVLEELLELLEGDAPMVLDDGLVLDDGVVVLLVEGEAPMAPVPEPAVPPPVVGAVVLLLGLAPVLPALAPPLDDCATA